MKQKEAIYTELFRDTSKNWRTATETCPAIRYVLERWQVKGSDTQAYIVRRTELCFDSYLCEMRPVRPFTSVTVRDFDSDEQALRWIVGHTEREFAEVEGYEPQDATEPEVAA